MATTVDVTPRRARFFYGWWVVFASASIVFFTGGTFFYGFGALIDPLTDEFGWSRAAISVAFSLRTEVGGVAAPVVGFLVDRIGPRRVISAGVLVVALGFVLMGLVQSLWAFYGAMVVIAIGISCSGSSTGAVAITRWFRRRRGLALGLLTFGGGVSGATVLMLAGLIDAFGWRNALIICGVAQLAISLPLALSIRDKPEDMGLAPDGLDGALVADGGSTPHPNPLPSEGRGELVGPLPSEERGELVGPLPSRAEVKGLDPHSSKEGGRESQHASTTVSEARQGLTSREALRTPAFWKMSAATTLGSAATTALIVHIVPFLEENVGASTGLAAASVTLLTVVSLTGRLGFGYVSDIYPRRFVMAAGFGLIAISMALWATVHEPWQLIYALPVFSLGFGGIIPARSTIQVEYFGLKAFGAIQGLMVSVATVGGVIGPVLAGWLYDTSGSYRLAFLILGAFTALAVPLMLTARSPLQTGAGRQRMGNG